jgi:hypothetical protein
VARAGTTRPFEMIALVFLSGGVAEYGSRLISASVGGAWADCVICPLLRADCAIGMAGLAQVWV